MKKILIIFTVISATLMVMSACNKEDAEQPFVPEDHYSVSDTVLKRGQTGYFGFVIGTEWKGDWTVTPNDGVKIVTTDPEYGVSARIIFTQPGRFIVTARAKTGGQVFADTVRVMDSTYIPPYHPPFGSADADDIIRLEPVTFRDDVLVFYVTSSKWYSCLAYFEYQNNSTATAVDISLGIPSGATVLCLAIPIPKPFSFIYTRGYANGVHPLTIRLGNAVYTGTVMVTDDKFTFNWPDNIPIAITSKQINRIK
ncbi:hypothetical protein [uncultured Chitinophaga sp.]|jgi:hypothetical protein|uniref:hypothetical protein n=1 Tax=uncultured Chitinophaga sp. TaxID=339340 RepID=UPI0026156E58|nr:hypothetical protein [uncultured Chitinophaga sp.]